MTGFRGADEITGPALQYHRHHQLSMAARASRLAAFREGTKDLDHFLSLDTFFLRIRLLGSRHLKQLRGVVGERAGFGIRR